MTDFWSKSPVTPLMTDFSDVDVGVSFYIGDVAAKMKDEECW